MSSWIGCCRFDWVGIDRLNVHSVNKPVFEGVDMFHNVIHKDGAGQIANDLMDAHRRRAPLVFLYMNRLNTGVQSAKLPRPVAADLIASKHAAAFDAVWPVDIGTHQGENGINASPVESGVRG